MTVSFIKVVCILSASQHIARSLAGWHGVHGMQLLYLFSVLAWPSLTHSLISNIFCYVNVDTCIVNAALIWIQRHVFEERVEFGLQRQADLVDTICTRDLMVILLVTGQHCHPGNATQTLYIVYVQHISSSLGTFSHSLAALPSLGVSTHTHIYIYI